MDNSFPYLKSIYVHNCYASQDFKIDFSPEKDAPFRHLVLTGKNGTGKTTILNELIINPSVQQKKKNILASIDYTSDNFKVIRKHIFRAKKSLSIKEVEAPEKIKILEASELVQYLVNKKTEQAFACLKNNIETAQKIEAWFSTFEQYLKKLFGYTDFSLEFNDEEYDFYIKTENQQKFTFRQLSDGYNSILHIFITLLLETELYKIDNEDFAAVVLIDEIEAHLHLELQETILPFLTGMFPKVQFIVATHSPAVIASIDNATVYDLSQHKTIDEDLRGYPYQFLMKEHFGIESEYSIAATKLLKEARALVSKRNDRTEQEDKQLQKLAKQLHELSPNLAFELFLELEREQLEADV